MKLLSVNHLLMVEGFLPNLGELPRLEGKNAEKLKIQVPIERKGRMRKGRRLFFMEKFPFLP